MSVELMALRTSAVRGLERTDQLNQPRAGLWGLSDLRRLVRMLALSSTGLVIAWLVASGTTDLPRQEMAVAGGIVAIAIAIAGLAGWLLAGMHAVRELRENAARDARALIARRAVTGETPLAAGGLVAAEGMSHHHLPSCLMVRGKALRTASGLLPCPICRPGEPS
jgi:hypothetical protein